MKNKVQGGATAVEFALVLPILLLLVFAILEFGLVLYNKAVITNASREAARYGVVMRTPKHTEIEIRQKALDYCSNFLVSLSPSANPDPTVFIDGAGQSFGQPLIITVNYTFSGLGLGTLLSPLTGPIMLTATTVMTNE